MSFDSLLYSRWGNLVWPCLGIVVACLVSASATAEPATKPMSLGINLAGVVDHSTEMPFNDLFTQARSWIPQAEGKPWGQGPPLELGPDGNVLRLIPGQFATTVMCSKAGHPAGRYVCLYDGEGTIEFGGCVNGTREKPGRIDVQLNEGDGLFLNLMRTNPQNPVRNIRIYMPGTRSDYQTQPFRAPFLRRTGKFDFIRFMDWMKTNNSTIETWQDRPLATDATQSDRGVSLEYMIKLCNTLKCDPWFCMPHRADDNYVREFAMQVRQELSPDLQIYIEYSNEVWNGIFEQAKYARDRGNELQLGSSDYESQLRFASLRAVQVFQIWEDVFASTDRLVRVLGSQSVNPWVSEQVASFRNAYKHADAIAIAPYFGNSFGSPDEAGRTAELSAAELIDRCHEEVLASRKMIQRTAAVAAKYGLELLAYEGGQHLVGHGGAENNERLTRLFHEANRHADMESLYVRHFETWKAAGGRSYAVFSSVSRPSKWGSWGLLECETDSMKDSPKWRAISRFQQQNSNQAERE